MKKLTEITRKEETYECDFCKKLMQFPTKECFGCGKHSCNESCNYLHMVDYTGGRPDELDSLRNHHGSGIYLRTLYFCKACNETDAIAKKLYELEKLNASFREQYSEYRRSHYKIAGQIERMIEKKEAKPTRTPT